jgi:hypothetical protein
VAQHHRVVVDVDDPRLRRGCLGDLVGIARGRQPRADVEKLSHPGRLGQVPHGARQECPLGADRAQDRRIGGDGLALAAYTL